ncbi:MAG: NAD-dependent epimerase/dehydratase family protein [Chloroflexi bacterium]|nr:NAD-dependent epimerase/dehydratase family protein [Chloroflexota bacterium]MCI0578430.1 NAD-dependent epimerase/dehydratase family protein [Chloroflexota bacterium]MCI0643876.1 NAD-dependent epimerase/dehydratase family protein [Chloroflexota bacterium]MCI0731026.1 NAD-dependent epimerase/dehydratase family protein [Chloroflexota bacterium]
MRVLITGGGGFLGAALANRLAGNGHEVRVLDDLSNGNREALSPTIHFTRGDVSDIPQLWSLLQEVDCVYHLAARVSVAQSILYPRDYNTVNVGGTVSLMEAMRDAGVRRVVLASSGAIYGQQAYQPVAETAMPQPDSPYAVSKRAAELYVHTIGALWGIETVALRIFNAYGPGQSLPASHAPVVPRFLQAALSGGSVVIFGGGKQSRDFIYVSDVVEALISAATAGNVNRQVLNIGSGQETTVNELVELIERTLGRPVNRVFNREKEGGVRRLVANVAQAQKLLGFQPQVTLSEGLRLTLAGDHRFSSAAHRLTGAPARK